MFLPCQQHTTYSPATIAPQVFSLSSVFTCSVPNRHFCSHGFPLSGFVLHCHLVAWLLDLNVNLMCMCGGVRRTVVAPVRSAPAVLSLCL